MSTPDQPDKPLTRRQLRELRNTASTPIITPEEAEADAATPVVAPLPRAAEPVEISEAPIADEDVDLDAPVLTRRAARQRERLRTASVPVITSEIAEAAADELAEAQTESPDIDTNAEDEHVEVVDDTATDEPEAHDEEVVLDEAVEVDDVPTGHDEDESEPRAVVTSELGADLLAGESVDVALPASFDQLLTRGTPTGGTGASNALILSQTPDTGVLTAPVTATGEVLVTGTFTLPESFGSTGRSAGSSDGKDIDATLIDGELPPSSSPTPIAASSAISTIKSADDIIKPPAPEKGGRLMLALGITAGTLALALVGVLIVAMVTGAFQ